MGDKGGKKDKDKNKQTAVDENRNKRSRRSATKSRPRSRNRNWHFTSAFGQRAGGQELHRLDEGDWQAESPYAPAGLPSLA